SAAKRVYFLLISAYSANQLRDFQTTLNLSSGTVSNPDFVPSATPASASIVAGNSAQFTIQVAAQNGFTGAVALQTLNLPAGVTSSFAPQSITAPAPSILTLSTAASLAPGTYTIPVAATSGTLSHTFQISLTVQPAGVQLTDLDIGAQTA